MLEAAPHGPDPAVGWDLLLGVFGGCRWCCPMLTCCSWMLLGFQPGPLGQATTMHSLTHFFHSSFPAGAFPFQVRYEDAQYPSSAGSLSSAAGLLLTCPGPEAADMFSVRPAGPSNEVSFPLLHFRACPTHQMYLHVQPYRELAACASDSCLTLVGDQCAVLVVAGQHDLVSGLWHGLENKTQGCLVLVLMKKVPVRHCARSQTKKSDASGVPEPQVVLWRSNPRLSLTLPEITLIVVMVLQEVGFLFFWCV